MDFALSPAQATIAARARDFAAREVAPRAKAADADGVFPLDLVKLVGELGFLAGPVSVEFGGGAIRYSISRSAGTALSRCSQRHRLVA